MLDFAIDEIEKEYKRLICLKETKQIFRMGTLFSTEFNNYYYDTGTGKVVMLDDPSYHFLNFLFGEESDTFSFNQIQNIIASIMEENLLKAKEVTEFSSLSHQEGLETSLNNELSQIILELTGRCNLRCGYCIYNENCDANRDFNQKNMSKEIAKAALEYARDHSGDEISITFYGGEPLLMYDLLKWSIEYAQSILINKKVSYSFTTNLTLMNETMADYFATVDNLNILCSFDGPEMIQNSYRKFSNGTGSYEAAINGLKIISEKMSKSGLKNRISINAVFAPPYSYEKLDQINNFFENLDFLPEDTNIQIEYVSDGSVKDDGFLNEMRNNKKYLHNSEGIINPLWIWQKKHFLLSKDSGSNSIFTYPLQVELTKINQRVVTDQPIDFYPFNGCCVPGVRRLYITTDGKFLACERIGNSPYIGDIYNGPDLKVIRKYYVDDYMNKSINYCKNCWAVRMCRVCYASCFDKEGVNIVEKQKVCDSMRKQIRNKLSFLHEMLEICPDKLDFLKDMEIK